MRRRMFLGALLFVCSVGCATDRGKAQGDPKATFEIVTSEKYEGAIVPCENNAALKKGRRWGDGVIEDCWTPSRDDVAKFEDALEPFLKKESGKWRSDLWQHPEKYRRQYFGFVRGGQRKLYANFFCDSFGVDWKKQMVLVFDGGDCFFQVTYDLSTSTFSDLGLNGYA